jgi:hypothetical protein
VWRSQLAANDFPPVCAMTGAVAETWRKFQFSDSPWWAFWVGGVLLAAATARRANGYLPLTKASSRSIRLVRLSFLPFIALALVFWTVAGIVGSFGMEDARRSAFATYSIGFGVAFVFLAVFTLLLTHRYGVSGRVMEQRPGQYEPAVELRNVHPAFVAAVQQLQHARAAQLAAPLAVANFDQPK